MHVQTLAQKCQIRSAAIGLRRGESALAPAGKGDAKTNAPDSGGPCRKGQAPATGQQRAPGFYSRQSARRLNGKLSPSASRPRDSDLADLDHLAAGLACWRVRVASPRFTRAAIMLTPKPCAVSNDCVAPLRPAVASMASAHRCSAFRRGTAIVAGSSSRCGPSLAV